MYSFYPGPSQLNPRIPEYMQEACASGILSMNHRSPEFVALSADVKRLMREKLELPEGYSVFYVSSATECWEIIAENLIAGQSAHLYNGAFGEKWMIRTRQLGIGVHALPFGLQEAIDWEKLDIPAEADTLCLTSCETSNGTQLRNEDYEQARRYFADGIIAVDATSSLGGIALPWEQADVWYASVQKCLGLPAGMALMICSPRAIERAKELGRTNHYNSVMSMLEQAQKHQTTHTPNVLNIFLLKKVLEDSLPIHQIEKMIVDRYEAWVCFFQQFERLNLLIESEDIRAKTVLPVKGDVSFVEEIKRMAKNAGYLLGNGYGDWKENSFRIANFPSMAEEAIGGLREFLTKNFE
ncbi:MAG: aminotransferase class V-fold PLP-dependent enzyme [Cytophagales bacterium]|nr:aminotransferase class V-fold PLP-dependent enzyme [Cytophagales bacterium]